LTEAESINDIISIDHRVGTGARRERRRPPPRHDLPRLHRPDRLPLSPQFPVGWTSELSTVAWIWLVLWGAAFVIREEEEIRFDIIYGSVGPTARRLMMVMTAVALVALYTISLPAVIDYVTFMKVQETSYLDIRFDLLFSIYVVFAVAAIIRYLWLGWRALRGVDPGAYDPTKAGSGV
jgi:C4-dicarboxylate transporter, DctQ subunit